MNEAEAQSLFTVNRVNPAVFPQSVASGDPQPNGIILWTRIAELIAGTTVAFEISRRHRFARDLADVPEGVEVHVLPAGAGAAPRWDSREILRYRDMSGIARRIETARTAAAEYLRTAV